MEELFLELSKENKSWYMIFEAVRKILPTFEVRMFVLLGLFLLLFIANFAYHKYKQKKKTQPKKIVETVNKKGFFNVLLRISKATAKFSLKEALLFMDIVFPVLIILIVITSFFVKPSVIHTIPESNGIMNSADESFELTFDLPIDSAKIDFNISPDIDGEWKVESVDKYLKFNRQIKFYPEESIYPGREVVIYVTGIKTPWSFGKLHEQSIEIKAPSIPDVFKTTPENLAENVTTDQKIEIEYNTPIGDFVRLDYVITPEVEFKVKNKDEYTQIVEFPEELQQDSEYKFEVYRTLRSYKIETNEDVEVGETELIRTVNFKTVTTPLVASYEPKGTSVLANSEIKIVFDQPMDKESVLNSLKITPEVKGEATWTDDKTLVYKPETELNKETEYTVFIDKGVLSTFSGKTKDEIKLSFTTIGKVMVSSVSPLSGTYGHNPKATNIVVEFNQPVDKASAQQKFSISPAVSGTFTWDGNKMIYNVAGKLQYSTRYNFSIASGVKTINGLDSNQAFNYTFVTRDNIFTLNVPWYKQQEGFTCNIAATRMALAYRGVYVFEATIKSGLGIGTDPNVDWVPNYGVHWGPVSSYIGQYRNVAVKSGWNVAELAKEVEKGNPVILFWYNRYSQPKGSYTLPSGATAWMGMHSEVVRGFVGDSSNPTALLVNDPWRGQLTYSTSLFISTWSYIGYRAVVVY